MLQLSIMLAHLPLHQVVINHDGSGELRGPTGAAVQTWGPGNGEVQAVQACERQRALLGSLSCQAAVRQKLQDLLQMINEHKQARHGAADLLRRVENWLAEAGVSNEQ